LHQVLRAGVAPHESGRLGATRYRRDALITTDAGFNPAREPDPGYLSPATPADPESLPMTDILKGITVLDLAHNIAGPFCTQLLGDFDAVDFVAADPLAAHPPGEGRVILVTDLAVFEFTSGGARALTRHRGVSPETLRERTPDAVVVDGATATPRPEPELLRRLRMEIDPRRVRDIEFASGSARRESLLRLHALEAACDLP
jgi:hypothetical protein